MEEVGHPRYKRKKDHRFRYTTTCNKTKCYYSIEFLDRYLKLPKLGKVRIRDNKNYVPKGNIAFATIECTPSGKYYCYLCCKNIEMHNKPSTGKIVGIDLGIKEYCITSDGDKYYNPKYLHQSLAKLKKLHRELDRKTSGGSNWNKQRIKLAKMYEKVTNQRTDFLQKLSTNLINENDIICMESLCIAEFIKNPQGEYNSEKADFRKQIYDVNWSLFYQLLYYKAEWYGKRIIKVDRYFPSSQICHICGYRNNKIKNIKIREWYCPNCGIHLDRDINAAINILNEAKRVYNV